MSFDFPFAFAEVLDWCEKFAVAGYGEIGDSQIDTNYFIVWFKRLWLDFTSKASKPPINLTVDCECFDFPLDGAMEFDFHIPDFGNPEFLTIFDKFESTLRVGERIVTTCRLESWVTGCFTIFDMAKEVLERAINTTHSVLENLRMYGPESLVLVFEQWQLILLLVVRD